MASGRLFEGFLKKIQKMLPSLEPETEEERLYELGKKRIYALHEREETIFYVENVWQEGEKLHLYGIYAKGEFEPESQIEALDNYGEMIFLGILQETLEERPESVKVKRGFLKTEPKIHLILSELDEKGWGEDYIYTNYLISHSS